MKKKISLIASILVATVLCGCGGPKYSKDFREWLGLKLASSQPIKLTGVKTEELSGGKTESVFTFSGDYTVTEPLYDEVEVFDMSRSQNLLATLEAAHISDDLLVSSKLKQAGEALAKQKVARVLKVSTPERARGTLKGKAKAQLNNDGSWGFQILDVSGATLAGAKAPGGKYVIEGTAEGKEYIEARQALIKNFEDRATQALEAQTQLNQLAHDEREAAKEKADEERRIADEKAAAARKAHEAKEEAAAKVREEAFLVATAEGQVFMGRWQGEVAVGEVGVKFGGHIKMTGSHSFDGVIFDPADPSLEREFSAVSSGNGTAETPYLLELRLVKGRGVATPWGQTGDKARETTVGLLHDGWGYVVPLTLSADNSSLTGTIADGFPSTAGPRGPIAVHLTKDYVPKGKDAKKTTRVESQEADSPVAELAPPKSATDQELKTTVVPFEEMRDQTIASTEDHAEIDAAMDKKDYRTAKALLKKMQLKYPSSQRSFRDAMVIATIVDRDANQVTAIYNQAMKTIPMTPEDKSGWDSIYKTSLEFIKKVALLPKPQS